jgi:hypothetical protein
VGSSLGRRARQVMAWVLVSVNSGESSGYTTILYEICL